MTYVASVILTVAAFMGALQWAHLRFDAWRIAPGDGHRQSNRYTNVLANGTVALGVYLVGIVVFGTHLVDPSRPSRWWAPVVVLLLYDFGYYWLHRGLHLPRLMRRIHWVHHRNLHPTAIDSLYLHPFETVAGLVVLLASVAIVGPMGLAAFVAVSLLHTLVNLLHHANLQLPFRLAWLPNHFAERHDTHHSRGGNYGVITPLWDWLFGTRG